jgi:hypothetical protein
MEQLQNHALVDPSALAAARMRLEDEEQAGRVVQVYRQVLIKDGEIVRPTRGEPAERFVATTSEAAPPR